MIKEGINQLDTDHSRAKQFSEMVMKADVAPIEITRDQGIAAIERIPRTFKRQILVGCPPINVGLNETMFPEPSFEVRRLPLPLDVTKMRRNKARLINQTRICSENHVRKTWLRFDQFQGSPKFTKNRGQRFPLGNRPVSIARAIFLHPRIDLVLNAEEIRSAHQNSR